MKFAAILLLPILLIAQAQTQTPCPPGDAARTAMLALGIQNKLLTHKIAADDMELEAPAEVGRDVVMLRKTLDVATQAFFHCEAANDSVPASLQAKLSAFLHTKQSLRDESHDRTDGIYGANLAVHIDPAEGFPNSLFVVLTFGIDCGNDNLLFLYTKEDGQWHQRLHWYSDRYTAPSDAFEFVDHKEVAGRNPNEHLIALIHGHAQCASVHSAFAMELALPASTSGHQEILDHIDHSFVIDDEFTVTHTATGIQILTSVESEDASRIWHHGILRFSTNTGKLILLPAALNARDFVDEWLEEPWTTVQGWSDLPGLPALRKAHDELGGEFGPVRACRSGQDHFQVEIDPGESAAIYAQVRQNPNSFTMLAITDKPDPNCNGPDLMKKPTDQSK